MNTDIAHARRAFLVVGVALPILLLGAATMIIVLWLPALPDPIATHWGTGGVDGFGPRWMAVLNPLIGLAIVGLLAMLAWFAHRIPRSGRARPDAATPAWSVTARLLGAVNLGLAVLLTVMAVSSTAIQRGLDDATLTPDISAWVAVGLAGQVIASLIGWFAQPRVEFAAPPAQHPDATPLAATERAAWFGSVSISRAGVITIIAVIVLLLALTVVAIVRAPIDGTWTGASILIASTVLCLLAISCGLVFRVSIGSAGLRVRSFLGWPDTRIPLDDITVVTVTTVQPFAEFGGWGWRIGADGRRGVVLRGGDALQVTRRNGTVFVVTLEHAGEAAATLEGLRQASTSGTIS
ncbi:DUF1648 domain-containing protein [Microbacterium sp. YY-01]|uniref:DUF1648 domain-containing protein n=1 Tax=Microbacterium sp. YY-01 TaxID=3421634 RepID=UPI003D16C683